MADYSVGQTLDVNGTPSKIAAFGTPLGLYSNGWVEPRVLNDSGQVAFGIWLAKRQYYGR